MVFDNRLVNSGSAIPASIMVYYTAFQDTRPAAKFHGSARLWLVKRLRDLNNGVLLGEIEVLDKIFLRWFEN